jgi:hypothetical protein
MPYLPSPERRAALEPDLPVADGAELNYVIARLVDRFVHDHGISYHTLEEIDGALGLSQHEFRRCVVAPYETLKRSQNGGVYTWTDGAVASLLTAHSLRVRG